MKVKFSSEALANSDGWWLLDRIVDLFLEQRHVWLIDDSESLMASPWLSAEDSRASRRNGDAARKCFVRAAYESTTKAHSITIEVASSTRGAHQLSADDARKCLESPVRVILENTASDGPFLDCIVAAFEFSDLRRAIELGWCQLVHAGGVGEVRKRADEILTANVGPVRLFVLVDSDRLHSAHSPSEVQRITDYCEEKQVPFAVLRQRAIENYIPVSALSQTARARSGTATAYQRLTQEQQSFFNLKSGFDRDEGGRAVVADEQRQLFHGVPQSRLNRLIGGFGQDVATLFVTHRHLMTRLAMTQTSRPDPAELPTIVARIESLL